MAVGFGDRSENRIVPHAETVDSLLPAVGNAGPALHAFAARQEQGCVLHDGPPRAAQRRSDDAPPSRWHFGAHAGRRSFAPFSTTAHTAAVSSSSCPWRSRQGRWGGCGEHGVGQPAPANACDRHILLPQASFMVAARTRP